MWHHKVKTQLKQSETTSGKETEECETVWGEQKPDKDISEGPAVASGSFMTRQILNQSWESVLLLPPAGSC